MHKYTKQGGAISFVHLSVSQSVCESVCHWHKSGQFFRHYFHQFIGCTSFKFESAHGT